jgi:5-methylcytosine-specific restriction endonuclease McrA
MNDLLPILDPSFRVARRLARWFDRPLNWRDRMVAEQYLEDPHCRYCRIRLQNVLSGVLDHCVPKSQGGSDGRPNRVLCCYGCDKAKSARDLPAWRRDLEAGLFSIVNG